MTPRIKIVFPSRLPLLRKEDPRTIANVPNTSGIISKLRTALIYPKVTSFVVSFVGGYDAGLGGT